ncbi:LexA family protein [Enterobacteriaceae bacterium C34A]
MEKKKDLSPAQAAAAQRLKMLYEAKKKLLGVTQQSIADELDITQGAVGHYLNGRNPLNPAVAAVFARLLQIRVEEFSPALSQELADMGVVSVNDPRTPYDVTPRSGKRHPVINSAQAAAWSDLQELHIGQGAECWQSSDAEIMGEAFWLKMEGDSMTSPAGLSVPHGCLVLFDTGRERVNNSLVLARLPDACEITFKKLIVDGGRMYLAGLNPQWPMVAIDDRTHFIGVALETRFLLI